MIRRLGLFVNLVILIGIVGYTRFPAFAVNQQIESQQGCTVFFASDDQMALVGNNEDWGNPFPVMWFLPPEDGKYGRVYFGFDNFFPQGGMNDQGLFFDGLAVHSVDVQDEGKPVYPGNLVSKAMEECATVECALEIFDQYQWRITMAQILMADSTGDSAIIEPTTIIRKEGSFQVAENFYLSETAPEAITARRYLTATSMLEQTDSLSVDLFRDILDATHQTDPFTTIYSNIYDLNQKIIYLYYFHDYENVVMIDLEEELAQGLHVVEIPSLFVNEAAQRWTANRVTRFEYDLQQNLATDIDPDTYAAYVGYYASSEDPTTAVYRVEREDNHLYLFGLGSDYSRYELYPQAEASFFISFFDLRHAADVFFVSDEAGQITQMVMAYRDSELVFPKLDTITDE